MLVERLISLFTNKNIYNNLSPFLKVNSKTKNNNNKIILICKLEKFISEKIKINLIWESIKKLIS